MNEAIRSIEEFQRRVMFRKRLLSLQDTVVLGLTVGGFIAAGLMLLISLKPISVSRLPVALISLGLPLCIVLIRWFLNRTREPQAAFAIDEALQLDDRIATARFIVKRGSPARLLQDALIADAAARIAGKHAADIVPFRARRWYAFCLVSLIAVVSALIIAPPPLPVIEDSVDERVDIKNAGTLLEQVAAEVEQTVPPESDTAQLAKDQAALGRALGHSSSTRADALQRLSALEERIRARHDNLKSTRADEIVTLAEQRLRNTLATSSEAKSAGLPSSQSTEANTPAGAEGQNQPQEPVSSGGDKASQSEKRAVTALKEDSASNSRPDDQKQPEPESDADETGKKSAESGQPDAARRADQPSGAVDALKALPKSVTELAAKALPKLSEDLLKKAAELRANQLTPKDVEQLRQAAEALSKNLEGIAQSQELRQALEDMAHQVTAEQIERVAHELGKQEIVKQELEAAARLLGENKHAKEMVAGLARKVSPPRNEGRDKSGGESAQTQNDRSPSSGRVSEATRSGVVKQEKVDASGRGLEGKGRESNSVAKLQPRAGGEYLYLQTKPGAGATRVPYSAAYPQYRREAERSVERTQVPPALRSVVRRYFDAINPDAKR